MKTWLIVGAILFALFLAALAVVGAAAFFIVSARPTPSVARPRVATPQIPRPFPPEVIEPQPNPNKNSATDSSVRRQSDGSTIERWEGYYYSSQESFERVCARGIERTRFWCDVRRTVDGKISADCQEASNLGAATLSGRMDTNTGELTFSKLYKDNGTSWQYAGKWNPRYQRIEGYWGERAGGFVLYQRHLSRAEIKIFERAPVSPPVPKEIVNPPTEQIDMVIETPNPQLRPKANLPKSIPGAEPKNDRF